MAEPFDFTTDPENGAALTPAGEPPPFADVLSQLGPPPPALPMPTPPSPVAMPSNVAHDPRQRLAMLGALAAALAGGPRSGLGGLPAGVLHGQQVQQHERDLQYAEQQRVQMQQEVLYERQAQAAAAQELQRAKMVESILTDVRKRVPTFTTQAEYDQYIDMASGALTNVAGSRLSSSVLKQQYPFVKPSQKTIAKSAMDGWLKVNADAVKADPGIVGRAVMDIDLNGDGTSERVPVRAVAQAAGIQFAQDAEGKLITAQTPGRLGDKFQEALKANIDAFTEENHRAPTAKEKATIVDRSIKQSTERVPVVGSGGAAKTGSLSPDGLEYAATQFRVTGTMPSLGIGGKEEKAAIINMAAQQAKTLAQSPAATIQKQAAYKSDASALTKMRGLSAGAEAFETKALAQADIVAELSARVTRSQWPLINRAILAGQTEVFGDRNASLLLNAITTFSTEYAKIMEGSTGSVAASSDSARRAAERLISARMNKGTLAGALELMRREMRLTIAGYDATIQHITERMGGGGATPSADDAIIAARKGRR